MSSSAKLMQRSIASSRMERSLARWLAITCPTTFRPLNQRMAINDHRRNDQATCRAERGLEPQMQKVQTSRHSYSGLARVRSAGEIVVGLDQNNLPFSTAHPEPAGLDFEIAGLLAKELDVRLRIYWAYSSHDSYPSKLSPSGLCDVTFGRHHRTTDLSSE